MLASGSGMMPISIHAPRTGSDVLSESHSEMASHFNPRSPHGERPPCLYLEGKAYRISIHAPRTGSDQKARESGVPVNLFQSTLPARGATGCHAVANRALQFQSTLPARGAT